MPMVIYGFFHCLKTRKTQMFLFYGFAVLWTFLMIIVGSDERWSVDLMPFTMMFGAIGVVHFEKIKPFYIPYIVIFNLFIVTNATLFDHLIVAKPLLILTAVGILLGLYKYRHATSG